MPNPTAKNVALPNDVFAHLNTLKVRLVGTLERIPTNGEIIEQMIVFAESHYDEFSSSLKDDN